MLNAVWDLCQVEVHSRHKNDTEKGDLRSCYASLWKMTNTRATRGCHQSKGMS